MSDPNKNPSTDFRDAKYQGYPAPVPPSGGDLPPGGGKAAVPEFLSFQGIYNLPANLYRWMFDQALNDSLVNALAMENDPVIYSALNDRQIQTAQIGWHIEPEDETDPAQVEAALAVTKTIERFPNRQKYRMKLLDAIWRGKSGAGIVYEWDFRSGRKRLKPVDWWHVNGDKIRGNPAGEYGIYVYSGAGISFVSSDQGSVHMLTPMERQQFVFHHFEPQDANWTQPGFTGQIMGVGLRSRIYWFWWLKSNVFAMLTNYLERFSQGVTILRYPAHDDQAKNEMIAAAQSQWGKTTMILPRWAGEKDLNDFQRLEAGTASPSLLQEMVTNYFDAEIRRAILHQDLTTGTAPTGLGSGVAEAHSDTMSRLIKYDAIDLQETEQTDLVNVLYRWDFPGIPPGRIVYEVDDPNAQEMMANAQIYLEMGGDVDLDQLGKELRLPPPQPGANIGSKVAPMQAAAVQSAPPDGMPVAGQPGPVPQQQQLPPAQMQQVQAIPGVTQMSRRGLQAVVRLLREKQRAGELAKLGRRKPSRNGTHH